MDKALNGRGGGEKGIKGNKSTSKKDFLHLADAALLTHLPELVVNQFQPGHVQVVQVVAAEGRRPGAAPPRQPAVAFARQLRQQSGKKKTHTSFIV